LTGWEGPRAKPGLFREPDVGLAVICFRLTNIDHRLRTRKSILFSITAPYRLFTGD
jgi:hypothetical protein